MFFLTNENEKKVSHEICKTKNGTINMDIYSKHNIPIYSHITWVKCRNCNKMSNAGRMKIRSNNAFGVTQLRVKIRKQWLLQMYFIFTQWVISWRYDRNSTKGNKQKQRQ